MDTVLVGCTVVLADMRCRVSIPVELGDNCNIRLDTTIEAGVCLDDSDSGVALYATAGLPLGSTPLHNHLNIFLTQWSHS